MGHTSQENAMHDAAQFADTVLIYFSAIVAILFAASYVLLFIGSRLKSRRRMGMMAYAAYAGLVMSVITLSFAANLIGSGFSALVVIALLLGYLLLPHAICHLGVCTRAAAEAAQSLNISQQH
jgi:hypothetical protein